MENNAEAGPSRLPAYTPAAQRRRSTRSVRQPSKDAIPVIERHAGSDLQRAKSLDGGLDVVMNGTSSSSSPPPATPPAAATSRSKSAKRKSDQMCHEGEQQEGGGRIQPASMRGDNVDEPSSEQLRSDEDKADAQAPTKRAREGEAESGVEDAAQQGVEAAELVEQSLNVHHDGGGAEAPASPRQEQLQPSQEPLQKSLEASQPASQAQRNDKGDEHAMGANVQDDPSDGSELPKEEAAASQLSMDYGQEKVNAPPDIDTSAVAAPSTSIAARGPPASLPLPRGNPSLDADTTIQTHSVSQSASNAYSRADALHAFDPKLPASSPKPLDEQVVAASQGEPELAQPPSPSPAPASPSGILDDLHQIGEEISQRSSWERDEEMDAERESCRDIVEDEGREAYISEDEATQQPIAGTLAQELMRRALAPEETSSSLQDDAAAEGTSAYMDDAALLDGQPLLSQWSEEPWQASDPFRTSTPAQAVEETTLSTSSVDPPPPTSPPKHHDNEDEAQQSAAAAERPEDVPTSTPSTHHAASSPGPSSSSYQQHHAGTRHSPSVEHRRRRQISRSISRRSRESFFDEGDDEAGDAFWDQVIDAADEQCDGAEDDAGEEWDLGDADMTLSQIDHDAVGGAPAGSDDEKGETAEAAGPQAIPAGVFAGFSTAANRRLPEPDAAAMERARRAFEIEETDAEVDIRRLAAGKAARRVETEAKEASESAPQEEVAPQALEQARPQQHAESPQHEQDDDDRDNDYTLEEQPAPAVIPQFVSFQKANGAALQLSKAAMEEAAKRMATWEAEHETRVPEARRELSNGGPSSSRPSTPLAGRLNGAPAATALTRSPLAPTASPHANRIVDVNMQQQDKEQAAGEDSLASRSASSTSQRSSQLRPDAPAEQPPATPAAAPVALPAFTPRAVPAPPPSLPSQVPQQMATPVRPLANRSFFSTSSVPHNPTSSASAFSPGPGASPAPRRPRLDARPSRISLGMTPRAKIGGTPGSSRAVFKTPFKGSASGTPSVRPPLFSSMSATAAPQSPFVVPSASRSPTKGPVASTSRGALAPTASNPAVFDLSAREGRLSLKEYGMIPPTPPSSRQRHQQQLARQQQQHLVTVLPAEIATILRSPTEAGRFAFKSPDSGEAFGIRHALAELHRSGATHIDEAWVRNHWCLIVWKLAAYVRVCVQAYPQAQAPLAVKAACEQWWTFDAAFRQLLYRYEREVNLAQRSVVKRVYEHDSPPGLPMVLLVSAVRNEGEPGAPLLELSDGWYRIPACVDAPLTRAIQRGKIRPGQKLALQGATLTSSNGGSAAGPKDPLSTSTAGSQPCLSLCGNGTSLATWDARLGARKDPMIATLRSLTPDGGAVPCMDIVITRLFPVAYCDGGGSGGGGGSSSSAGAGGGGAPAPTTASFGRWGAAEEAEAQREWERRYEDCRARLAAEAEKEAQAVADLQELLRGYLDDSSAEDQDGDDDGSADSAASHLFDELVNADNMAAAALVLRHGLAELTSSRSNVVRQLVSMAAARAESQRMQWSGDVEAKLAKMCPRRRVRSFRVCRFVDAASRTDGEGASQLRRPCKRTVQLTIWDVDGLGGGGEGGKTGAGADGFLAQGHRYRVTNLMPAQKYAWRGADVEADVFLATRRDSRWMRV